MDGRMVGRHLEECFPMDSHVLLRFALDAVVLKREPILRALDFQDWFQTIPVRHEP